MRGKRKSGYVECFGAFLSYVLFSPWQQLSHIMNHIAKSTGDLLELGSLWARASTCVLSPHNEEEGQPKMVGGWRNPIRERQI